MFQPRPTFSHMQSRDIVPKSHYHRLNLTQIGFSAGPKPIVVDNLPATSGKLFSYNFELETKVLEQTQSSKAAKAVRSQEKEKRLKERMEKQEQEVLRRAKEFKEQKEREAKEKELAAAAKEAAAKQAASVEFKAPGGPEPGAEPGGSYGNLNLGPPKYESLGSSSVLLSSIKSGGSPGLGREISQPGRSELEVALAALTSTQESTMSSFKAVTGLESSSDLKCIKLLTYLDWDLNRAIEIFLNKGNNIDTALTHSQTIWESRKAASSPQAGSGSGLNPLRHIEQPKAKPKSRINVMMPDNSVLSHDFDTSDTLWGVYTHVATQGAKHFKNQPFSLANTYPKEIYSEVRMSMTLEQLGLVPNATLRANSGPIR